jgi:hypothetical protein
MNTNRRNKMIAGTVIPFDQLTVEDVNYYNDLEERDTEKAVVIRKYDFKLSDGSEPSPEQTCPNCGESVSYGSERFCQYCGQRLKRCKDGDSTQHKSEASE